MVFWATDNLGELEGEEKAKTLAGLDSIVRALSAEAGLFSQAQLDRQDAKQIAEGRKLLVSFGDLSCTECHKFHDEGELGTAPDLTGYGSRAWMIDIVSNPEHERFYGDDRNDRMPSFAGDRDHPEKNLLTADQIGLIVDWLRGEWPREAPQ